MDRILKQLIQERDRCATLAQDDRIYPLAREAYSAAADKIGQAIELLRKSKNDLKEAQQELGE